MMVGGGRLDDWTTDDAGLELNAVPLLWVEREGSDLPQVGSDCQKRCKPEVADCTLDYKYWQEDQSAEECYEA